MPVQHLNPPSLHPPAGQYSHVAVASGNRFAFIAGQVALDQSGQLVGSGDVAAQTRQALANLANLCEELGATPSDIVELRTFVVGSESLDGFRSARTEAFSELFPNGAYPPNTLLVVSGLASDEFKIEISAVVALGSEES